MSVLNNFVSNPRHSTWKTILDLYPKVLKIKAEKKTKKSATKELLALDKWCDNSHHFNRLTYFFYSFYLLSATVSFNSTARCTVPSRMSNDCGSIAKQLHVRTSTREGSRVKYENRLTRKSYHCIALNNFLKSLSTHQIEN